MTRAYSFIEELQYIHDLLYTYLTIYTKHSGKHLTAPNYYIDIIAIIQAINYISYLQPLS
ncbi:unnamed protein product [Brassica oleracea var. botrytis]